MNRFDFLLSRELRKGLARQGTRDGLFPISPPLQNLIRGKEGRELIGRNSETPVSPVPRPLSAEALAVEGKPMTQIDLALSRERFSHWMSEPERRAKREGWSHDDCDDCC